MSDNDDILGDDFVDQGFADDTYNLGNEEEDILLADDTFELNHYEAPKQPIIQEKLPEPIQIPQEKIQIPPQTKEIIHEPVIEKAAIKKPIEVTKKVPIVEAQPIIKHEVKPLPEKVAVVPPEPVPALQENKVVANQSDNHDTVENEVAEKSTESNHSENHRKVRQREESRYRAGHRERFPTERESGKPPRAVATPHIPDTLDSVVTPDSGGQNFHGGRGSQNFRGDRRQAGRGRDRYFPERSGDGGSNLRPYPDFRRHPNAPPPGGNFIRQPNPDFGPPFRGDSRDFGPEFNNLPPDFQRGPGQDVAFSGRPDEMGGPSPFLPRQDNRNTGRPFNDGPRFPSDMNRRPPVGLVPPLFETFHGPVFRHESSAPHGFQTSEAPPAKKVLINPHFKGPLPPPPQRLVYPTSRPPPGVEMRQRPPPLGDRSVHMSVPPPYLPAGLHHGENFPPRNVQYTPDGRRGPGEMGYGGVPPFSTMNASGAGSLDGPVSDEALERLTEQFIDEQRRCLQKAKVARNDDFFEKTQRFIENTTKDVRSVEPMMAVDPDAAEKERLRRKQEEFIDANRHNLSLNLRRRRQSPPHRLAASVPSKTKPRKSFPPAQRKRSRSPLPQNQSGVPPSDPEEREYRVRLREQAEMRERVLLAKERRRRRDANSTPADSVVGAQVDGAVSSAPVQENTRQPDTTPKYSARAVAAKPSDDPPQRPDIKKEVTPAIRVETVSSTSTQPETVPAEVVHQQENETLQDTEVEQFLDDLLEDDALHLSAADEDLLLSDEDPGTTSPHAAKQIKLNHAANANKTKQSEIKPSSVKRHGIFKASVKSGSLSKPPVAVKRSAIDNSSDKADLRSKLARSNEPSQAQEKETSRQGQPRRQIVYSDVNVDPEPTKQAEQNNSKEKVPQTVQSPDKWRLTFAEQKAKRMAPIAARAISAVIRTATSEANVRKVIPPARQAQSLKIAATRELPAEETVRSGGIFGGRRVVLGAARGGEVSGGGRVVLPRQKRPPILVVEKEEENEEPEPYDDQEKEEDGESGSRATVGGLPPGMTEARLLSLCGSQVEKVKMGTGSGSADVTFQSSAACQRFITRFNGRFVAASCLSVRLAR